MPNLGRLLVVLLLACTFLPAAVVTPDQAVSFTGTNLGNVSGTYQLNLRAWYPEGVTKLRGILVVAPGNGGDLRPYANAAGDAAFQAVAARHGFALVGMHFSNGTSLSSNGGFAADAGLLVTGINQFASATSHPELTTAPIAIYGFSNGSGYAVNFAATYPSRTIAFAHNKGVSYADLSGYGVVSAAYPVPGLICYGENDTTRAPDIRSAFATDRGAGAKWHMIPDWGLAHDGDGYGHYYGALFLDRMIPLRLPPGWTPGTAPALVALNESAGWLGDDSTVESPLAAIAPASAVNPLSTQRQRSWIPTQELAVLWRAISTHQRAATLASPRTSGGAGVVHFVSTTIGTSVPLTFSGSPALSATTWVTGTTTLATVGASPWASAHTPQTFGLRPISAAVTTAAGVASTSDLAIVLAKTPTGTFAPTVATTAAASPATVTGTSSTLTVLGADDGGAAALSYTWATIGTPPASVTFTANGSNAAKTTTAQFSAIGTYQFQVTITDADNLTTTSTVTVTVNQGLTTLAISPANPVIAIGASRPFTVSGQDQFGGSMAVTPAPSWTVTGGGSITASGGSFTAGSSVGGPFTVTVTAGAKTATTTLRVQAPPTVAQGAQVGTSPVTGTTTTLSALGASSGGEASLTYFWSALSPASAGATFSPNGTNAAKATTVTFAQAGSHQLQVTITDASGLTVTSTVTVVVNQVFTQATVSPATIALGVGEVRAFTATGLDQFGRALATAPAWTWTATGGGSISPDGTFTAGTVLGGPFQVQVTSGARTATAALTVVSAAASGSGTAGGGGGGGCGAGSGIAVLLGGAAFLRGRRRWFP